MAKITKILVVNEPSTRVRVDELSGFSGTEFDVDEYFGNAGALRKASGAAGIGFGTSRDMEDRTSRACAFGWGDSEAQTAPTGGAIARSATDWDIPQESAQTAPTGGAIARSATDWDIPPTGAGRPVMRNGDAIDIDAGPKTVRPAPIPTASFVVAMRYRPGSMLESSRSYRLEGGSRAERKYSTLVTHCLPSVPRSPFLPSWHWLCRTTTAGT